MVYNNKFTINDFVNNPDYEGIFPQINQRKADLTDDELFKQCQDMIASRLGGEISGDKIVVDRLSYQRVMTVIKAYTPLLETFFDQSDRILRGLKNKANIYTTIQTKDSLTSSINPNLWEKVFKQLIENIRYSPDFGNRPSRVQTEWMQKVKYKDREINKI